MNKTLLVIAAALAASAVPTIASAQLAFNAAVVTDYRYRGISQSKLKPAVSAGVDYAAGAFYVGAWASSIKWVKEFGGDSNVEIDLYGGYKGELAKDVTYDVGLLTYIYPSNGLSTSANTTELYGAVTFGPATLKYSHAVTDTFGNAGSKNSFYLDLSAGFDVGGVMVTPHIGHQKIKGSSACTYTDYSVAVSKDFSGFVPSLMVVGTNAKESCYLVNGKDLGKTALVLGLKYNF
ncbi:MAG: TorF family putative porin [Aquabacterium sp.]|nr:TorF family putative porin [Aquabacterium sp.]